MSDACAGYDLLLMAYADGEASAEERERVEAHLPECPRCQQRLTEWRTAAGQTSAVLRGATAHAWGRPPTAHPAWKPAGAGPAIAVGVLVSLLAVLVLPRIVAQGTATPAPAAAPARHTFAPSLLVNRVVVPTPTVVAAPVAPAAPPVTGVSFQAVPAAATTVAASTAPQTAADTIALVRQGSLLLADAKGERALPVSGQAAAPRWSASRQWLMYETVTSGHPEGTLWFARPDGATPATPAPDPASSGMARWSPRRDEAAVARRDGSLWLVEPPSGAPRDLLPAGGMVSNFVWAPDGSQLAVERRGVDGIAQAIWLVGRDGSKRRIAADAAAADGSGNGAPAGASTKPAPTPVLGAWSPNGDALAIWLSAGVPRSPTTPAPLAVWTDAQGARTILPAVLLYRDSIAWSPDGKALAAVAAIPTATGGERGELTVTPLSGGEARRLSPADQSTGDVAWSPDGGLIAYAAASGTGRRIWVTTPDGSERRPLSPGADDGYPEWSRHGDRVLYVHQTAGGAELWSVERDGSDAHRVASGLVGIADLPRTPFGSSGLVSYRGLFAWRAAQGP